MEWSDLGLEPDAEGSLGAGRIAGRPLPSAARMTIPNPADGSVVGRVGWADPQQVRDAVSASMATQCDWAATPVRDRARALRAIADDLRAMSEPLGDLICAETGKLLAKARAEVGFSARYFDWFADAATHLEHQVGYRTPIRTFVVERQAAGVVAAISPWNFPLSIPARKLAPALAAGCGVVQKPSEAAPLSTLVLDAICAARLPEGLVNTVVGDAATSTALLEDREVRVVSFTGSTVVGRIVAERCAPRFARTVLELGGRAPFVVCEDADTDVAVEAMLVAKLRNNGASCLAANNLLVHADRYDEIVSALKERLAGLVVGDPRDPATGLGPLIRSGEPCRLADLVETAGSAGARVTSYGEPPAGGCYTPAYVVEDPPPHHKLWGCELFGPVFSLRAYTDEAAMVAEVNGWGTGLGGYVMSADVEHQVALARALRVGIVGINNGAPNTPEVPFGGRGESGLGYEGGLSGLLEFTVEQTLSLARAW